MNHFSLKLFGCDRCDILHTSTSNLRHSTWPVTVRKYFANTMTLVVDYCTLSTLKINFHSKLYTNTHSHKLSYTSIFSYMRQTLSSIEFIVIATNIVYICVYFVFLIVWSHLNLFSFCYVLWHNDLRRSQTVCLQTVNLKHYTSFTCEHNK